MPYNRTNPVTKWYQIYTLCNHISQAKKKKCIWLNRHGSKKSFHPDYITTQWSLFVILMKQYQTANLCSVWFCELWRASCSILTDGLLRLLMHVSNIFHYFTTCSHSCKWFVLVKLYRDDQWLDPFASHPSVNRLS